jgi:Do/DeqQ family serine protease
MDIKNIAQGILTATAGGVLALCGFFLFSNQNQSVIKKNIITSQPQITLSNTSSTITASIPTFENAAKKTLNSVVHIKTISTQEQQIITNPFQRHFFGNPEVQSRKREISGSGSGVIISSDGYITTNNHVIKGAKEIQVTLNNKQTYTATIVGVDPTTDLALIKINEVDLPAISYGNSDELNVGEWVLAVGNPFNLNSTVTAGIVSAKGRNINILKEDYAIESFIQTDAAVNPGNSGGALVNQNGELIGINTAIASNTGSYTGYSFAVPVNMVKKIMGDLLNFGTVQRALLGIQIIDMNQELAELNGIENLNGVYISKLMLNGAAKDGGLKEGDVIRKVGNTIISSSAELQEQIGQFHPGDKINITFEREGELKTTELTLKNKLGTTASLKKEILFLGAKLDEISSEEKKELGIVNGVRISALKAGKLMREGIKKNFIITKINNRSVSTPDEVMAIIKKKKGGFLIEGIYPNGIKTYYGFGI